MHKDLWESTTISKNLIEMELLNQSIFLLLLWQVDKLISIGHRGQGLANSIIYCELSELNKSCHQLAAKLNSFPLPGEKLTDSAGELGPRGALIQDRKWPVLLESQTAFSQGVHFSCFHICIHTAGAHALNIHSRIPSFISLKLKSFSS